MGENFTTFHFGDNYEGFVKVKIWASKCTWWSARQCHI